MKLATTIAACAAVMVLVWAPAAYAHGDSPPGSDEIRQQSIEVRQATRRFKDERKAVGAGYAPFAAKDGLCVAEPGAGGMGIHYLNADLVDDVLDSNAPEALMYQPHADGRLELVGVEYIVFQERWDALHPQPPTLFGHPFHLVRAPNRYDVPAFYELHLWIWKHNRNGLFADWNPAVTCP